MPDPTELEIAKRWPNIGTETGLERGLWVAGMTVGSRVRLAPKWWW